MAVWLAGYSHRTYVGVTNAVDPYQKDVKVYSGYGTNSNESAPETPAVIYMSNHCNDFPYDIAFTKLDKETRLAACPSRPEETSSPIHFTIKLVGGEAGFYIYYGKAGVVGDTQLQAMLESSKYWTYESEEILGLTGAWGAHAVDTPFLLKHNGTYYLFVAAKADKVGGADDNFRIYVASASNIWGPYTKLIGGGTNSCIVDLGAANSWDDEHVGKMNVFHDGTMWCMYHTGEDGTNWGIGLATCADGDFPLGSGGEWDKSTGQVLAKGATGDWDNVHVVGHNAWLESGTYYIAYTGYDGTDVGIGMASASARGGPFTKTTKGIGGVGNPGQIIASPGTGWCATATARPLPIKVGSRQYLLHDGWNTDIANAMIGCSYNDGDILDYTDWNTIDDAPIYSLGRVDTDRFGAGNVYKEGSVLYLAHRITTDAAQSDDDSLIGLTMARYCDYTGADVFTAYEDFNCYDAGVTLESSTSWTQGHGQFDVQMNITRCTAGTTYTQYSWDDATYADGLIEARVRLTVGNDDTEWWAVYARRENVDDTFIQSAFMAFMLRDGEFKLHCTTDGALDTHDYATNMEGNWHVIGIGLSGDDKVGCWDFAEVLSGNCAHFRNAGYAGIDDATTDVAANYTDWYWWRVREFSTSAPTLQPGEEEKVGARHGFTNFQTPGVI